MRDRLIAIIDGYGSSERKRFSEFADLTGLDRDTVKNLYHGKQRINEDHIAAICAAFPKYKMWLVFGETYPEIGQVSPDLEEVQRSGSGAVNAG